VILNQLAATVLERAGLDRVEFMIAPIVFWAAATSLSKSSAVPLWIREDHKPRSRRSSNGSDALTTHPISLPGAKPGKIASFVLGGDKNRRQHPPKPNVSRRFR